MRLKNLAKQLTSIVNKNQIVHAPGGHLRRRRKKFFIINIVVQLNTTIYPPLVIFSSEISPRLSLLTATRSSTRSRRLRPSAEFSLLGVFIK